LDEYIAEHKEGDVVTGRLIDDSSEHARVELGEGVQGRCRITVPVAEKETKLAAAQTADLSSLSAMLNARWKGGASASSDSKPEAVTTGQIRSFRITKLDPATRKIHLELA
ncbi:MAG TPA: 30S ribosomal protein S1, partial [Candidatus Angelobacter sp.]|nr:30S ribosomal protein S1 [Candidatus Angelobacter sp.]